MQWLQSLDIELFRWINLRLASPVFDVVMPWVSGNAFFLPVVILAGLALIGKGGARGRVCVLMLALLIPLGDGFVCNTIKHAVGRLRPFDALSEVRRPGVKAEPLQTTSAPTSQAATGAPRSPPMSGSTKSMPSSHAANWFAAAMIAFVFYRRSAWFMVPAASLVSFSRIYNGVHYPSDVLAGALLGAGCAVAGLWLLNTFWQSAGSKWFPLWWEKMPSLLAPVVREENEEEFLPPPRGGARPARPARHVSLDAHWLRLGYLLTALLLVLRWAYIASGTIQLSEDEAYQWLWSKHLAISYYSKPPLIAYTQFLSTTLWGDNAFGVRFFSPLIAALLSLLMLRFLARVVNARAGFFLLLILTAMPLAALGSVLMTVDPLSVLFWTAAMVAGWRAVQDQATTVDWLWVGLWMGLGFLSKYTELFQWLCWAVFFVLWRPARKQLRRPGPYAALLVNLVCAAPVLIWNSQRHWITVRHVMNDAGAGSAWHPTLRYVGEFIGSEAALLNPFFFIGIVWAAVAFWRRGRQDPKLVYFFSMGAPLFLAYLAQSFHSRVFPNWIAPAVLPLGCLLVTYWDTRWRLGSAKIKPWLNLGLGVGFATVILAHNTDLIGRLTGGWLLPVSQDPLHRVRVWSDCARVLGQARQDLLSEGKPVFIIGDHYGLTSLVTFYLPEAKAGVPDDPIVYFETKPVPENQFYFWPSYCHRQGQNAVYFRELDRAKPVPAKPPPPELVSQFDSVTDLGVRDVLYHGRLCRPLQLFACRGLK